MHKAISTVEVRLHFEIKILNPVLGIVAASPRGDHGLGGGVVPDVAHCFSDAVLHIGDVDQLGVL